MRPTIQQTLIDFYLEYVNDFISLQSFANSHSLARTDAEALLALGKKFHEENSNK